MNLETLDQLPDGKTELPATVVVDKMKDDVKLHFKFDINLKLKRTFCPPLKKEADRKVI